MHITLRQCWSQTAALGGLMVMAFGFVTGSALAQDEEIEEITVTGSRIARDPNLSGALPVQTVNAEEIQMSGEFSLADVVNDVPALLSSVTSENSIDDADFADGANVLDLRGLGANRTLVLVDGRRHVGGVQGSSAVDVGSLPMRLVERVEVLSGGASAIYGADAVTGVVNFILKDDYEGFGIDANVGISAEGDGQQTALTATWGTNFADDRGNIAISVDWRKDDGLTMGDRRGALYGTGGDWVNPDLRFQQGEIGGGTPLFEQYYNYNNTGLIHYGLPIPDAASFVADYNAAFGTTITEGDLNAAEMALIQRGATAPQRAVLPEITFPFTSAYGYVANGEAFNFGGFDPDDPTDIDNNGVPDCQQSFFGYNSTFGAASFGAIGGCWHINADGSYNVVNDGLVASATQGFGGDSYDVYRQDYLDFLLPDDKISVNVMGHFDLTDSTSLFGEVKYVTQEVETSNDPNSFWDLLLGAPDNPFLPQFLQQIAAVSGGVSTTVDPHMFDSFNNTERETVRTVIGLEGELDNGWRWEVAANYGRHERTESTTNDMLIDRWFAAIDATTDGNGAPACRSSVDVNAPGNETPFGIPSYDPGYFSFTPGDGQCAPLDIWNGRPGVQNSQAALDFILVDTWNELVIDQFVLSAYMAGDTADWFEMPAGAIAFAFGAEWRDESSESTWDPLSRGVIPAGAPFPAGTQVGDVSANDSLTWRPQLAKINETGSYDVADVYVEASIPLLSDVTMARELTLELAARLSDYSTIGQTTTWKSNVIWAPVDSLTLRGSYSEAVRAPNITELFGPAVGLNFRPDDPCDVAQINAIAQDDPTLAAQTQANCEQVFASIGLDPTFGTGTYAFADPLTASFGGLSGGNRNLTEETAETLTVGLVFQPDFVEGLSFTVDYWDIAIDDAIEAVTSQNIVDGCYQGATLNLAFCDLTGRNSDPNSAQYGGFNFLNQTTINFAKVETDGIDFAVNYAFEVGANGFDVTLQGSKINSLDQFQNPLDLTEVNPELKEVYRPDFAGNIFLNWSLGDFQVGWQSQYVGEMLFGGVEVETANTLYGPTVFQDELWIHDISARYMLNDEMMIYGGVKNLSDEQPYITENAFPASPRGTFFFLGFDWQM